MLELKAVGFEYKGGRRALSGVDLSLTCGGIVSIVGPNGSGKTTLLRCIDNLIHAEGEILLHRRRISDMSRREVARSIGYVPQSFAGSFPVTVFDMVLLGRKPYVGWSPSDADLRIVSENIASLGLGEFALRDVNQLSGGERQKVLIARALSQQPEMLLLDEPTSSLDIRHQLSVMRHLREIVTGKGLLALLAIHDLNLASQYSDYVVMMHDGRVYAQGTPDQVFTRENIQTTYGVDVAIHQHGDIRHIVPVEAHAAAIMAHTSSEEPHA
ncbi:MAG: ABC transporter ATP-binding protein [Actinomycetota bacterium]|nr:ABC transporter ATP-binding protein [Actinomycetota bacterium]